MSSPAQRFNVHTGTGGTQDHHLGQQAEGINPEFHITQLGAKLEAVRVTAPLPRLLNLAQGRVCIQPPAL
jgi:hypothetical protein